MDLVDVDARSGYLDKSLLAHLRFQRSHGKNSRRFFRPHRLMHFRNQWKLQSFGNIKNAIVPTCEHTIFCGTFFYDISLLSNGRKVRSPRDTTNGKFSQEERCPDSIRHQADIFPSVISTVNLYNSQDEERISRKLVFIILAARASCGGNPSTFSSTSLGFAPGCP